MAAKKSKKIWLNLKGNPSNQSLKQIACFGQEEAPTPDSNEIVDLLTSLVNAVKQV